jgi:hypothetical protein
MQRAFFIFVAAIIVLSASGLRAEPPAKTKETTPTRYTQKTTARAPSRAELIASANGWVCVNGEWVHPDGYKFVTNKILRTTAKPGQAPPKPPGKLALENPAKLTARPKSPADEAKAAAEKAAERRQKNLAPTPASQTGTHL